MIEVDNLYMYMKKTLYILKASKGDNLTLKRKIFVHEKLTLTNIKNYQIKNKIKRS